MSDPRPELRDALEAVRVTYHSREPSLRIEAAERVARAHYEPIVAELRAENERLRGVLRSATDLLEWRDEYRWRWGSADQTPEQAGYIKVSEVLEIIDAERDPWARAIHSDVRQAVDEVTRAIRSRIEPPARHPEGGEE